VASPVQPQVAIQHSHRLTDAEPWTFEKTLRELIRSSPYFALAVVVHVVIGFVLVMFAGHSAPQEKDQEVAMAVSLERVMEALPPPPPPPERTKTEELPEHTVEDPNVVENELAQTIETPELTEVDSNATEDSGEGTGKGTGSGSGIGSGWGNGRGNGYGNGIGDGLGDVIGLGGGGGGGGGGGKIRSRKGAGKAGGEPLNRAVDDALMWLKNHQNKQGFWSCAAFDAECGQQGTDTVCDGAGSPQFDVGVTGLSLLAFLGANNTHKEGKYSKTVRAGLKYLVQVQGPDGNFGLDTNSQYTYDHIIATLAMSEAYALTKDHLFKAPAEKALKYLYKIRNPTRAWRYAPYHPEMALHPDDMSVTGWAIMAMTLAREYQLPVDNQALDDGLRFLEEMTDPLSGRTGYFERGGVSAREFGKENLWPSAQTESITAVAVLCRIFADPKLERKGNKEMVEKGIKLISTLPPLWDDNQPGRRDFYFWYYGTYALYQYGGPEWKAWERTLMTAVAEHQHKEGEMKGSWDPQVDPWGDQGGRVYSTAILALCLEVFYRYDTVMGSHK
jgi:hypothetical protein